jgi:hypothetical protein
VTKVFSVGRSVKTGNNARNGGKNSLNRLMRMCLRGVCPDPRNFTQRVSWEEMTAYSHHPKSELFYAGRAIRAGANGFVSKRKDLGEIYNAVEMILMGYSFFPSETLNFINHLGSGKGWQ